MGLSVTATITFTVGTWSLGITRPLFDYTTRVKLPWYISKAADGKYSIFDNGAAYDTRECEFDTELSASEYSQLTTMFKVSAAGRAVQCDMNLGSATSGFYPFGPDKGDVGVWQVQLFPPDQRGRLEAPYDYFGAKLKMVNVGLNPTYSLPTQLPEGELQIGNVNHLRYPSVQPRKAYGFDVQEKYGAGAYAIDNGVTADSNEVSLGLTCNQSKAAALISDLTNTLRSATFTILAPTNYYLFDYENGDHGNYAGQLLQNEIEIVHNNHDSFEINLQIGLVK